jgi:glyoxylase-like metal-dependent hydrolase (beta-lactamase superfamily II)
MIRETLPVGILQCNCSILGDETTREAIVVDPGADIARILVRLAAHRLTVKQIVITHAHIDHIAGAQELKRITGAPILYNQLDLPLVAMMDTQAGWIGVATPEVLPPDASLGDLQTLQLAHIPATVLHTPGHTPGSLCLYLPTEKLLIAGDTLFAGSIGRTDLPGGDAKKILSSIHERLLTLPDETRVIPGHGPATTVGTERQDNPWLQH